MAYTSQTIALMITISTIHVLRSPTLRVCQALYTCGMKVMLVRKAPSRPTYSIQGMVLLVV